MTDHSELRRLAEAAREELRTLVQTAGTQKALAEDIGISPQYLHDILNGKRNPGERVLDYLGLQAVMVYVEKPISEP